MQHLRTTIAALLLGSLVTVASVHAQPSPTPPTVATFVEAPYPPAAREAGREATVELEITVGADGRVLDARVLAPAGDGFDEAALTAVRQFVFTPATRDGRPIAARIQYRYRFELEEMTTGQIEGRILSRTDDAPLPAVEIVATGVAGGFRATTDESGGFVFTDLPPGAYRITIAAVDHAELVQDEEVRSGQAASVTYRLTPAATDLDGGSFGATATIEAPAREITRRSIEASEMTKMAGTRGDALRGVELMPGVGRPPSGLGMIIVRGSAPTDSQVYLDGAPVQQLYHFGGLTSFVNGSLLQRIDLYPGNFSARYGRKIGGIVEAELRDPRTDRHHAELDVNMTDAFALVEGPIDDRTSFAVAGRRSYVDAWIGPALESMDAGLAAVPVYYDWQAIVAYKPGERDRLRLIGYASSDDLRVVIANPGGTSTSRDRVGLANSMTRVRGDWTHTWPGVEQVVSLVTGVRTYRARIGPEIGVKGDVIDVFGRADWKATVTDQLALRWGVDVQHTRSDIEYDAPAIRQVEGNPDKFARPEEVDRTHYRGVGTFFRPAVFAEAVVTPVPALELVGGVRVDRFDEIAEWAVDPRATARYTRGATTFKGGVGRFSQPPEEGEALEGLGNPDLRAQHAIHYGLGVDHELDERVSVGVEGYYKRLDDMITTGMSGARDNSGTGRIYGLEVAGRWRPGGAFSGFLSYTLSRSERNDGGRWRLFDYDQTHILTVSGAYKLGRGWELGSTFRLVSGNPETPVVGSIFDGDIDSYRPIYGAVNSSRNPMFHRLDVRVEKQFRIAGYRCAGYLDVQNAYNRQNREGTAYNFDYSERRDTPGLPLLPSLGIKGEL
ncbi:MAG: TonB family protein [Kofleriaceae bacterium]|nr:MAG: TonB family protein [Kofleriaceae bacterium]